MAIAHSGAARHTVTLDDGSVWTIKSAYNWLAGADGDWQMAAVPHRYHDRKNLSAQDKEAIILIANRFAAETGHLPPKN